MRNSSDYFEYKRNKIQSTAEKTKKPISKINFLIQLFIVTFIVMFIIIAISIMKYSSKVDIEYTKGELSSNNIEVGQNYNYDPADDKQGKIDKRLILIQQEENAPSEARIIEKDVNNVETEVIDPKHLELNKKIEKEEKKQKAQNLIIPDKEENKLVSALGEITNRKKEREEPILPEQNNVTIMSKVLIGKYATFEDAQAMQNEIKTKDPTHTPFVRKIGEVYSVQMGSYQDFEIAKKQAQALKAKGLDVWIYQQ